MKTKILLSFLILSLGIFLISCQGTQEQAEQVEQEEPVPVMAMAQVRQTIEEVNIKFGEAIRMGDAAALANLYTDDAVILTPEGEKIRGREGIEAYFAEGFRMGIKDVSLTTLELFEGDDLVCEIGKAVLTIQPEGQKSVESESRYIAIWKKASDGTLKLRVNIMF